MARNKSTKAAPKTKSRGKAKTTRSKNKREPPEVVIRRNAAPKATRKPAQAAPEEPRERTSMTQRVHDMGASHVAAGIGGGALGNVIGVVAVGQGWVGPKATAGILIGTGAATTAAGWYWEQDHVMAAGIGLTAAGTFSIANQLAVDAYESIEKRAEEQRKNKEEQERNKRLAMARAMLEAEKKKKGTRNARRIVVLDQDGEIIDYSSHAAA